MEGELLHDLGGGKWNSCEPVGEFCQGLGFDAGGNAENDVVEKPDLIFAVVAGAGDEKVGDARQRLNALLVSAGGECVLEFLDERCWGRHGSGARNKLLCEIGS